jgi:uncharacterized protein (TIGR00369 family)
VNLRLRPVHEADLAVLHAQQADAEAQRVAGLAGRERDAYFVHMGQVLADPANVLRVVEVDGAVAGLVLAFPREGLHELGYWLGRAYWGRGILTRALAEFVPTVGCRPLHAHTAQHNAASLRALQRLGFEQVATRDDFGGDRGPGVPGVVMRLDNARSARVQASLGQQRLMDTLGARLARVEAGRVDLVLPMRAHITQQDGFVHAGAIAAVVDSACGYAAYTLMPEGARVLSVEFKLNLMAPARGERFVASGRVVRAGRTLTVCQGELLALTGNATTAVAAMQATMMTLQAPDPGDGGRGPVPPVSG